MATFVSYFVVSLKASSVFYVISCALANGTITIATNQFHLILAVLHTRFTLLNDFLLYEQYKKNENVKDKCVIILILRKTFSLTDTDAQATLINSNSLLSTTLVEVTRSHQLLNKIATQANNLFTYHVRL